ncbi:hypothetical protein E1B25_05320 [Antarcticimicrobium sediminis]|uniref:Uncharacterized protein n=2 Tax=Antarcticimicrobium sediminis TaxID=2546227 RepID=A0A4R5EZ83_9RHOB|nr:hypothetical protein E1B25_05320 [Antarcticimicrobium sediminis]
MSVSFRIFPDRGLAFVRYTGFVRMEDTLTAFADYARDPDCKPGQKQLVDLSKITGYEPDFTKMMQVQANKADVFAAEGAETLMVYYAPNKLTQDLARLALRSWEPFDSVVALIQEDEAHALELLGQPERAFDALWALAREA